MNYKKIITYITIFCMQILFWYILENKFLDVYTNYDLLCAILGTHGGYGFFLMIATVFMLIHLFLISNDIKPFSVVLLSRKQRSSALKICYKTMVVDSFLYAFFYVIVQVIYICIYVDIELLLEICFFEIIFMYFIGITVIFIFGASIYLFFYICIQNKYPAMILAVIVNVVIAYFTNSKLLYGGIEIIDKMTRLQKINVMEWIINQIINVVIISIIFVLTEEVYRKRDIYDRI